MNILGLNYIFHDSTACLVQDGRLTVAIEEERLTRQKHTQDFPRQAIARCLAVAGLTPDDIDHIAVSYKPTLNWARKAGYGLKLLPSRGFPVFVSGQALRPIYRQGHFGRWFNAAFTGSRKPRVHYVPHHLSHAVGSFLVSPYESAALLSTDGSGEWATTFKGIGRSNSIECLGRDFYPQSQGDVYGAVTEFCGFKKDYDEGKTMGLAPLGNPDTFGDVVAQIVRVKDDMTLGVDLSYFGFPRFRGASYSNKFTETFGLPRQNARGAKFEQNHLDVAAAFQRNLEECLLSIARKLRERSREDYLVISGGVALNSVANGRLVRESGFKDVYVMPAPGDNGTAIGAAFFVNTQILGNPRTYVHDNPYVGTQYSDATIQQMLDEFKLEYEVLREGEVEPTAAELLLRGRIIGWFQGRMEIGPRALGNRSILANPTLADMKDRINAQVKHREAFRPFAPSCPIEDTPRYFEQEVADPFMLKVCDVRPEVRHSLPAITHVDGTARLQTVHADTNPRYYRLHKEFEKLSGFPVLLNTSFNVMGEPIVESPSDAVRCFFSTGLDYLVLGNLLLRKQR